MACGRSPARSRSAARASARRPRLTADPAVPAADRDGLVGLAAELVRNRAVAVGGWVACESAGGGLAAEVVDRLEQLRAAGGLPRGFRIAADDADLGEGAALITVRNVDGDEERLLVLDGGAAIPEHVSVRLSTVGRTQAASPACAIVVLGHASQGTRAAPRLSPTGRARLQAAERLAERVPSAVVVFSGLGRADVATSEAALMASAWQGPAVPILLEIAARTTAENALLSAVLVRHLHGCRRVVLVTSWWHCLRARLLFGLAMRGGGRKIGCVAAADPAIQIRSLANEIRYLTHMRRNVAQARRRMWPGTARSR